MIPSLFATDNAKILTHLETVVALLRQTTLAKNQG